MSFRLRILHISDLHERVAVSGAPLERKRTIHVMAASRHRVLDRSNFFEVIEQLRRERDIDVVCFTGDVADWGLQQEYEEATRRIRKILVAAGVDQQFLYVVPGNHDVARKQQSDSWGRLREFAGRNPDATSKWLAGLQMPAGADAAWPAAIAARTDAFWRWVARDLGRSTLLPQNNTHGRLGYRESACIRDLPFPVHVIGLDTAWLAGDDNDARKLLLTEHQITMLARDARGAELSGFRLALMHHPLSDLADEHSAVTHLSESVDVALHGHQHEPISELRRHPDRSLVVFAAGSLYEGDVGDKWLNSFQVIDIVLNEHGRPLRYEVRFFGWSKNGHWYPCGAIYKSASNGVLTLDLAKDESIVVTGSAAPPPAAVGYVIPRRQTLDLLKRQLIDEKRAALALIGPSGAGKSTLAVGLVQDPHVVKAFPDGIFWITIGHDRASLLSSVRAVLLACGDFAAAPEQIDDGYKRLAKSLHSRAALLVLDNVWQPADTLHFNSLGQSTLLITTREWAVAEAASADPFSVGPLTEEESLTLFERRLARVLSAEDRSHATKVAAEVGRWPLSVAAVCNRIREGDSWPMLLLDLQDEVKRLRTLEVTPDSVSMAAAVELSIRTLHPEDAHRFALLSLFAEDARFTSNAAANLWHLSIDAAEQCCRVLRRKELLMQSATATGRRVYRLHDQHRDAGRRMLNLSPRQAHARLLSAYAERDGSLSRITDDGYFHDHLIWHIVASGELAYLPRVLCDEHSGRNIWFDARADQPAGYLDDLTQAFNASMGSLGLQLRYSLMLSSVASLSSNVPGSLYSELVARGVWSPDRAVGHALALPPSNRAEMLCLLLPKLEGWMRQRCFETLLADLAESKGMHRVHILSRIPLSVSAEEAERVLELVKSRDERGNMLMGLQPMVSVGWKVNVYDELRRFAVADCGKNLSTLLPVSWLLAETSFLDSLDACEIQAILRCLPADEWLAASAAVRLGILGEIDTALSMALDLPDEPSEYCLGRLAPLLRKDQLIAACTRAEAIESPTFRTLALAPLYARLEEPERTQRIAKLWEFTPDRWALLQYLPPAFAKAAALPNGSISREMLIRRLIGPGMTDRALEILGAPRRSLHTAFKIISEALSEAQIVRLGLHDSATDPWIVAALLPRWLTLGHRDELSLLLQRVASEERALHACVEDLAPHLDNEGLSVSLAICTAINDEPERNRCLFELAAHAPKELESDLFARQPEACVEHDHLHQLAEGLPIDVAQHLRERSASPLHRLAISSTFSTWQNDEICQDLLEAEIYMRERFERTREAPLSSSSGEYRRLCLTMDCYVRAFNTCPVDKQSLVRLTGRTALQHFGLAAPRACVSFYSPAEVVRAAKEGEHNSIAQVANVAALLEDPFRAELVEWVVRSLERASPSEIIKELSDARELPPTLLDLLVRAVCETRFTTDVHVIGLLAKAGRLVDALTVLCYRSGEFEPLMLAGNVELALNSPWRERAMFLKKAWDQIFNVESRGWDRNEAELLAKLMPVVATQSIKTLGEMLSQAKPVLCRMRRRDLYAYLGVMAPMLKALGGSEVLVECAGAVKDVARWWP